MQKVLYHLYELKNPAGRDASTPKYKLVKGGKEPGAILAWRSLYKKSDESPEDGYNLLHESQDDAPDAILPGAEVSVFKEVAIGPPHVVRRWFVEYEYEDAERERCCDFLDLTECNPGLTCYDYHLKKHRTLKENEDGTKHVVNFDEALFQQYNLGKLEDYVDGIRFKKPIKKPSSHTLVIQDKWGNDEHTLFIEDIWGNEKEIRLTLKDDGPGKKSIVIHSISDFDSYGELTVPLPCGDLKSNCMAFFGKNADDLAAHLSGIANGAHIKEDNLESLLNSIDSDGIIRPESFDIVDPGDPSKKIPLKCVKPEGKKWQVHSSGTGKDAQIAEDVFLNYFGGTSYEETSGQINENIRVKRQATQVQRQKNNLELVKGAAAAAAEGSSTSISVKIFDKDGPVNVQLTCDKDGNVSGLKKNATSSMFWSSQRDLSSADYQALFGVDNIDGLNAKLERLKTASAFPGASTPGGDSAGVRLVSSGETSGGVVDLYSSSDPSSTSSADDEDSGTRLATMRSVLSDHRSPDKITAGDGDQAFTIERTKFIDGLDTSQVGTFTYQVCNKTATETKTACVQLSAQKKGFRAKATTLDGASQDAQLVACALALAEGHLAQAKPDSSATDNLEVNFTVHLGDKHHEKVDLIKDAISQFYEAFAKEHSCTIEGTVQFSGRGEKLMSDKKLTVEPPSASHVARMGGSG